MNYQHGSGGYSANGAAMSWYNGMMIDGEQQQQQQQQSSNVSPILSNYQINSGEILSSASTEVYRLSHDSSGPAGFYSSYQTTAMDSDQDENDLDDDSDDEDTDSTYIPKRSGHQSSSGSLPSSGNNSAGKNSTNRRSTRPNGSKRKRKRVLNGIQRAEATQREKRRMLKLNRAFEDLRKVLPVTEFARNKLSRSETLKSAIDYINLMYDMLDASKGHQNHNHHSHHYQYQ